ncbi:MAG: hypothetical protein ACR2G6_06865 [Gemmatimonadaceae bacterium]
MLPLRFSCHVSLSALYCRRHHRIPHDLQPTEHGFRVCTFRDNSEEKRCGLWLYIVVIRGGDALITDVELEDVKALNDPRLTPTEILRELRKRRNAA